MKSHHDLNVAGHFGRDMTLEQGSRNFYWPEMEDEIRKF
jgi:hypothetical protein